ncbi:dynamin family protein [Salegentibacter maritimus]|uniref:Dynamin family protein n=1 Tax=Salegentibacter maritimus TaxID=2794347 RepID=A0ABS0TIY1_9FLAO|nr:dynamin family protein [Salegentibacter maritimus]MBI6121024.1 dynamin family protein [Salegentibacter maritimus]
MTENIFKTIADKKNNFKKFAQKALEFEWITQEEFQTINLKLENDVLTIGVIGQMKCGKSTLLNALVYGKEVLPAATTPMTASLAIITYGEEKKIEAEFYNSNEWEELKHLAKRNVDDVELDDNLKSKIKAAKEIVEKSYSIGSEIQNLLNTKQEADFNNLIDYVGADGKYISITKAVKIFMPLDYLKGVEIVDTPGFNDPIVSREERTKAFLAKADAVIMLLYAGRAFDSVDKDIIFNQLRKIGIGKLLIGVNKYDVCIENESEAEIISNVKKQLKLASKEFNNNSIAELVMEKDPLLLSANMALMAKMNFESITKDDKHWGFYYKQASDIFGISSQQEMLKKSLLPEFEKALMEIIFESKDDILLKKPINLIKQKGEGKLNDLVNHHTQVRNRLTVLNKPDSEREQLLKDTKRSEKKIKRKVDNLEIEIEEVLRYGVKDLTRKTKDLIYNSKRICKTIINDHGVVIKSRNLHEKLYSEIEDLEIESERLFEHANKELNLKLKAEINKFISDVDEIAEKYDEDFDVQEYITSCKEVLQKDVIKLDFNDLLPISEESQNEGFLDKIFKVMGELASFGGVTTNIAMGKSLAIDWVDNIYSYFDLNIIENEIKANGVEIVEEIKTKFLKDLLSPIICQLEEIEIEVKDRKAEILEKEEKVKELETEKNKVEEEITEMQFMM